MSRLEQTILDFFNPIPHIISVTLFGSQARQTATETSDVDIALLFDGSHVPKTLTLIAWREDLSALLHKDVDLICLNTASPIIGMQVYSNGKNLLVHDDRKFGEYQMRLFIDYAELKEIRAPMEKNILKRKFYDKP